MKYLATFLLGLLFVVPSISFAQTVQPSRSQLIALLNTLMQEVQALEAQLNAIQHCPSGQAFTAGSCQWTASSTAAMAITNGQMNQKKNREAESNYQNVQQRIDTLQSAYTADVQDQQNAQPQQCLDPNYQRVLELSDNSFGGSTSIADGNRQIAFATAAAADAAACTLLTAQDKARIQVDESNEASIQVQIRQLQAQL